MEGHLPKQWVAGIYKNEEWYGKFYATADELLEWCEEEMHDELVVLLVLDICDALHAYQDWWDRVRQENN